MAFVFVDTILSKGKVADRVQTIKWFEVQKPSFFLGGLIG
jgi:hypothetical protein